MIKQNFQNVIIGFGKGGKTLAKALAIKGETVALIEESDEMYGGTCINIGCIPSKSLIVNGERKMPFQEAITVKTQLVSTMRSKNYHNVADQSTATVFTGKAKFLNNTDIEITFVDKSPITVSGDRIFINTGATPVIPDIQGVKACQNMVTSKEIMELTALPQDLVIIGSGYVGLEFASMFRQFGSKVTVLEVYDRFIPREDEDISQKILDDFQDYGVTFHFGVKINKIEDVSSASAVHVTINGKDVVLPADKILVATGRTPNIKYLGLENTDIKVSQRGAIEVNDFLETSVPNIWALGDVHGGMQFTYTSLDDFRIVLNHLYGDGKRKLSDRTVVPYSVFINPPLSNVGLTEKEAQSKGIPYKLAKLDAATIPKAAVLRNPRGLLKALINPETDEILGASLYCEESYELINYIALAMKAKVPYTMIRDQVFTHPTMSEGLNDLFNI